MKYRRMPIEEESPEQFGYDQIARLEQHREIYGTLVSSDLDAFNAIARRHGLAGVSIRPQD